MTRFLPGPVRGVLVFIGLFLNTVFFTLMLVPVACLKLIMPVKRWRAPFTRALHWVAETWMGVCLWLFAHSSQVQWDIYGDTNANRKNWYLLVANHQSWVDIFVVLKVFRKKIPFPKFFLKRELIWVPFLGFAWWALDYPFMKRDSSKGKKRKSGGQSRDLKVAQKACETFKQVPATIMNFVEGTRFTARKHRDQQSPFKHLLKPKAGGLSFALSTMGEQLHRILNVTIMYPEGARGFWDFMCGKVKHIKVHVESLPVGNKLLGDYLGDPGFREQFQSWVNGLWAEKDQLIEEMLHANAPKQITANEI